jgi:hypothetical protein
LRGTCLVSALFTFRVLRSPVTGSSTQDNRYGSRTRIPASCRMAAVSAPFRSGQIADYRSARYAANEDVVRVVHTLLVVLLCTASAPCCKERL